MRFIYLFIYFILFYFNFFCLFVIYLFILFYFIFFLSCVFVISSLLCDLFSFLIYLFNSSSCYVVFPCDLLITGLPASVSLSIYLLFYLMAMEIFFVNYDKDP